MSLLYHTVIPLNPIPKKNNNQIVLINNHYSIIPSKRYKDYEKDASIFLRHKPRSPISSKVEVKYLFYRKDKRRCDLSNLTEAMDDILVNYLILKDDNFNIIASHDGSRVFVDASYPRTEIYIYDYKE